MPDPAYIAAAAVVVPVLGAILVERIRARAASKRDILDAVEGAVKERLAGLAARVAHVESVEPAELAKLREDVEALGADLHTLRTEAQRRWTDEDKRRERAAERAEKRDERERERMSRIDVELAVLADRVSSLLEKLNARR